MPATERQMLPIAALRLNGGTQPRALVEPHTVQDYADALDGGAEFPPVTVFYDGNAYWLADGFHRVQAHEQLRRAEIAADVRQGTRRDAVLFSVGANAQHGLRRTNADKRRAVETLLRDAEWGKWVDAEISRRTGVSAMSVGRYRAELISNNVIDAPTERKAERNGTTYTQNTSNIGKRPTPAPQLAPELPTPLTVDAAPLLPVTESALPVVDMETGEVLDAPAAEVDFDSPALMQQVRPDEAHVITPVSDHEYAQAARGWDDAKRLESALDRAVQALSALGTYSRTELSRIENTPAAAELLTSARIIRVQQLCAEFLRVTDAGKNQTTTATPADAQAVAS